jgi:hypothetical protein
MERLRGGSLVLAALLVAMGTSAAAEPILAPSVNLLFDAEGRIEPAPTADALQAIGANGVLLELGYDLQWQNVLSFLPEADRRGLHVYLLLPDARHGVGPPESGDEWWWKIPKPHCKDYVAWMEELAKLSLEHPSLEGVLIDDFECGANCLPDSGFTVDYIRRVIDAKDRINPRFRFIPGIYLPSGMSDFRIRQKRGENAAHNTSVELTADVRLAEPPKSLVVDVITRHHPSEYFVEQLVVNGEVLLARPLDAEGMRHGVEVRTLGTDHFEIRYRILHTGYVNYLDSYVLPRVLVEGEPLGVDWTVSQEDDAYLVERYFDWLKQFYDMADGVIFWSNEFDLVRPDALTAADLLRVARERLGEGKLILGHFYGAEPWGEPVFPSRYYFDEFARANLALTGGANPWFAADLAYYGGYANGIYRQPACDRPDYAFRFRYPAFTPYDMGTFHGIQAEFTVPDDLGDAELSFDIEDTFTGDYAGRWVKELVVKTGRFTQRFVNSAAGAEGLWFAEEPTLWWDFVRGDEGRQHVALQGTDLQRALPAGETVTLQLRLRADMFRGAASAPPEVNCYVTAPRLAVAGRPVPLDWRFTSGNAFEPLWLGSSEQVSRLFQDAAAGRLHTP